MGCERAALHRKGLRKQKGIELYLSAAFPSLAWEEAGFELLGFCLCRNIRLDYHDTNCGIRFRSL